MPPCVSPEAVPMEQHQLHMKAQSMAAFKRDFWWPCHTSSPKARRPLSLHFDTWMIGASTLYQGLLCDREAEWTSCREHILHIAIYCSHKAHQNLHTINHRVSKAEGERETVAAQQRQDSRVQGSFPSQRSSISIMGSWRGSLAWQSRY